MRTYILLFLAALFMALFAHGFWNLIIHYQYIPPAQITGFIIIVITSVILTFCLYNTIRELELGRVNTVLMSLTIVLIIIYVGILIAII